MIKAVIMNHFLSRFVVLPVVCLVMFSCASSYSNKSVRDIIDPDGDLDRKEYEKILPEPYKQDSKDKSDKESSTKEPAIPEASQIITAPKQPDIGPDKLVSISVTEDVPLKDVLIELGRLADVDMEIDSGISGGIIIKATNKPFNEVIKRVADLGNLRYENKNGSMKIERDLPYQVDYITDFLNIVRSSSGNINVNTNVIGSGGGSGSSGSSSSSSSSSSGSSSSSTGGGGGGLSSGSTSQISASYEGDLWKSVEATVKSMIADSKVSSGVLVQSIVPIPASSAMGNSNSVASTSSSNSGVSSAAIPAQSTVNLNKEAGIISVVATDRQHNAIEAYLSSVKKNISSQVLIEAKIVEVTLDKNYSAGINWGTLSDENVGLKVVGGFNPVSTSTAGVLSISSPRASLSTLVSMLESFGTAHTISSPRLHAMNNQQAVMTVAENKVYFTVSITDTTPTTSPTGNVTVTTSNVTSTLHTVPIGIILTMQPSINLSTNEVTMNIRPTLTTTDSSKDVEDPAVALTSQKNIAQGSSETPVTSSIPVINVRELDSVMKIKSGEIMIMGGLMKNNTTNTDKGVPVMSHIPFVGNVFKSVQKADVTVETVIFIKATIMPSDGVVAKADKDLYHRFIRDPRPLAF